MTTASSQQKNHAVYPENSIILAPLSGYTDLPYRNAAARHGCKFAFTEMIDAGSLSHHNAKTAQMLLRGKNEQWLGTQLVGSDHERIIRAVELLNEFDFSVLDFNLGCPVPKVYKKGAGAALGSKPVEAAAAFALLTARSRFPVTAKIRILDENNPAPTIDLAKRLEAAGAAAITIHGRVRTAFYAGPVFTKIIAAVREAVNIQVIANGGITGFEEYQALRKATGCSCVMVARGALGNPWLFAELSPDHAAFQPPDTEALAVEIETHIREMSALYGEEQALRVGRKIILDYLKGRGFPGTLKSRVSFLKNNHDFALFMESVRHGPSERYWKLLEKFPTLNRRIQHSRDNCHS